MESCAFITFLIFSLFYRYFKHTSAYYEFKNKKCKHFKRWGIEYPTSHSLFMACEPPTGISCSQFLCGSHKIRQQSALLLHGHKAFRCNAFHLSMWGAGTASAIDRNTSARPLPPWYFPIGSPLSVFADTAPITRQFGLVSIQST